MNKINPWHDISPDTESKNVVRAIIEIPKDSTIKYELDKDSGLLKLDRFLYSAVYYPGDYGFIPQTLWDDGDPSDIIILTSRPVYPLTLVNARIIGVVRMIDGGEKDDKILAVYDNDPRFKEINDINDLQNHIILELRHFFETYKELQGKKAIVPEILSKSHALKDIEKAKQMYKEKFLK